MIFNFTKHNNEIYSTLLKLSRNLYFYKNICLKDSYETRIYLMFIHFAIILISFKKKKVKFPQKIYDNLFFSIENNMRELGFGDVAVNKKMKDMNKIFYDILLKFNNSKEFFSLNKILILKYFNELNDAKRDKYELFDRYFINFYHFCFELSSKNMIKEVLKFKV